MTITIEDAREAIRRGAFYGDVYVLVAETDRESLEQWYLHTPGLPNLTARQVALTSTPTGETCKRCGGFLVRTGTCMTCQGCGESSGGCG